MTAHTISTPSRDGAPPSATGGGDLKKRRSVPFWRRNWLPYALILPALCMELLVHIVPMMLGVWISFVRLTQLTIRRWITAPFVGLENYANGLNPSGPIGSDLIASFVRTVAYTALVVVISWGLGIVAAVILNSKFRGRGWFRMLFLVPFVLPSYVGVIGWAFMFNQQNGMINHLLVNNLHLMGTKPFWLIGGRAFWVTVIVTAWRHWPFAFLMLLAALQTIPDDLYEAAALDGATPWRQFREVTLPMIRQTNAVVLLMVGLWAFNEFTVSFLLFGPLPPPSAQILPIHIYGSSFVNWNFGLGAAMSTLLLVALLGASIVYIRLVLPKEEQHA